MKETKDLIINPREKMIMEKFSNLVGTTLLYAESAIPVESQCKSFKKILEKAIYDTRNSILVALSSSEK